MIRRLLDRRVRCPRLLRRPIEVNVRRTASPLLFVAFFIVDEENGEDAAHECLFHKLPAAPAATRFALALALAPPGHCAGSAPLSMPESQEIPRWDFALKKCHLFLASHTYTGGILP